MPEYQYIGVNRAGKKIGGKLDAPNEGELRMILRGQGLRPIKISRVSVLNADLGSLLRGGRLAAVPLNTLVSFTTQLHVLVSSGVPLVSSLEVLADQASDRSLKSILTAVREKVSQGSFLWESLSTYPESFPRIYIALLKAGESSGSMDVMLKRLSRYLEDAERLRRMVKGAMVYPAAITMVGIGVLIIMLTFVIPKMESLLSSNNTELPLPTQIVINLSHFFANNFPYVIGGMFAAFFLGSKYFRSKEGRGFRDKALFRVPMFGDLMQKAGVARFSRTMSTLLSSGINLLDAVDICRATVDNAVIEQAVSKIRREIESGRTLGIVVKRMPVFPKMAVQMIGVGEQTGNLDKMLDRVADFYEAEVENTVANLSKLIEPLILVLLGGAVAGMLIAMYLPIFKLAGSAAGGG